MSAPIIYRLSIERFRCITAFSWLPAKGVNLILGGDVGKTTILDAIGLLLSPTNPTTLGRSNQHPTRSTERQIYPRLSRKPRRAHLAQLA